jgi:hypothetical protein
MRTSLLGDKWWKVSAITSQINCAYNTVGQTFYHWSNQGIEGLFDAPYLGRKPVWNAEAIKYIE